MKNENICLISPRVLGSSGQVRKAPPPFGIATLAASLIKIGYNNVQLIDAVVEDYNNIEPVEDSKVFTTYGLSDKNMVKMVKGINPDFIGISALFSSQTECAFSVAKKLKEELPNIPIAMGGNHATECRQEVMKNEENIDFILAGEADLTFPEFIDKYFNGGDCYNVPGLLYRKDGIIHENPLPIAVVDLDQLSFPAWHLYDMDKYYEIGMPHNPFLKFKEYGQIITSRGCPAKCYFCSVPDFNGSAFRYFSAKRIINDIENWVKDYSIKELQILDDTFTTDWKRVIDIMNGIKKHQLRISLPNAIRGDYPRNIEKRKRMFNAMAEAGVFQIDISVEHGDQDFLNNVVGKDLDLETIPITCDIAHEAGMTVHANFMMGFPFENEENRQKTIEYSSNLDADSFSISLCIPLPGTRMANIVDLNGLYVEDFNISRMVLDEVSIQPYDIEPEELKEIAENLNRSLNEKALMKRPETLEKYLRFHKQGKTAEGDRKFHFSDNPESLINA